MVKKNVPFNNVDLTGEDIFFEKSDPTKGMKYTGYDENSDVSIPNGTDPKHYMFDRILAHEIEDDTPPTS